MAGEPDGGICCAVCLEKRRVMQTIVLTSQKGGSGKSTLTIGVAIAAMGDGHRVAIIDTDPQGTVSNWGRRRTAPEPYIHRLGNGIELERPLLAFRRVGFTLAIIDTPATHNALSSNAISASNMCLIPARPSPADIEATLPTLGAVRKLGKPFAFVLNQAPPRGYRLSEAAAALNAAGVLALPYIVQRNDHQDALGAGFGVTEFAPDGLAAREIVGLWQYVWKRMKAESIIREQVPIKATG
jgi:chromosome partitioning protein